MRKQVRTASLAGQPYDYLWSGTLTAKSLGMNAHNPALNLPPEQYQAIKDYADYYGPRWKAQLRKDWMASRSDWPEATERWCHLQCIRNNKGGHWLLTVRF